VRDDNVPAGVCEQSMGTELLIFYSRRGHSATGVRCEFVAPFLKLESCCTPLRAKFPLQIRTPHGVSSAPPALMAALRKSQLYNPEAITTGTNEIGACSSQRF
jgi:hypothetical protein